MLGVVSEVSGERAKFIFEKMPLKVAFAFEHFYFVKHGYDCKATHYEQSLEELVMSL
jgi:hypothetical protein